MVSSGESRVGREAASRVLRTLHAATAPTPPGAVARGRSQNGLNTIGEEYPAPAGTTLRSGCALSSLTKGSSMRKSRLAALASLLLVLGIVLAAPAAARVADEPEDVV